MHRGVRDRDVRRSPARAQDCRRDVATRRSRAAATSSVCRGAREVKPALRRRRAAVSPGGRRPRCGTGKTASRRRTRNDSARRRPRGLRRLHRRAAPAFVPAGRPRAACRAHAFAVSRRARSSSSTRAVATLVATGTSCTSHARTSAVISGSCGCAVIGSRRKITMSTRPSASSAPICKSPPSGPDSLRSTSSPCACAIRPPVVPVATSRHCASVARYAPASATMSSFFASCAISAMRGVLICASFSAESFRRLRRLRRSIAAGRTRAPTPPLACRHRRRTCAHVRAVPRPPAAGARTCRPATLRAAPARLKSVSKCAGIRAAVEQPVLPGDVARMDTAEERARRAELVRRAEALRRNFLRAPRAQLVDGRALRLRRRGERRRDPVGVEEARQQVVDRHVVLGHLAREPRDEAREPRARAVGQREHVDRRLHGRARDVDDAPEAARDHPVDARADQLDRREHVRLERANPVVVREIAEVARRRAARVRHENVRLRACGERRRAPLGRRDVARDGRHVGARRRANIGRGGLERLARARDDHEPRALGGERLRATAPKPLAGRAHERGPSCDSQIHESCSLSMAA
ncbi:cell wall surface anchor family protein [Burkholderia pseudomallei MSHR1043]|nr:cell wall surface anchor family protein [Burkholderia pseudomallei MSHR1043]